jgi:hypothetical protein
MVRVRGRELIWVEYILRVRPRTAVGLGKDVVRVRWRESEIGWRDSHS